MCSPADEAVDNGDDDEEDDNNGGVLVVDVTSGKIESNVAVVVLLTDFDFWLSLILLLCCPLFRDEEGLLWVLTCFAR